MTEVLLPSEACHWYTRQGAPCYEVTDKNGKMRPTTLADARKLDLVPSVTTIINAAAKPGLQQWKLQQMLLAALTLPRLGSESIEDFSQRVILDSEEQSRKAAERGTELHAAIEDFIKGEKEEESWEKWKDHLENIWEATQQYAIDLSGGRAEHSFASPLGYGGKLDWHNDEVLIDFKTKDRIVDGKQLSWPEHCWQLAAYNMGLNPIGARRLINVFIGVEDCSVRIHEWARADAILGEQAFKSLLEFWHVTRGLP